MQILARRIRALTERCDESVGLRVAAGLASSFDLGRGAPGLWTGPERVRTASSFPSKSWRSGRRQPRERGTITSGSGKTRALFARAGTVIVMCPYAFARASYDVSPSANGAAATSRSVLNA